MELGILVDDEDLVLVQFTSSFAAFLGRLLEVCGSTPRVSQTQLATRKKTWRLKRFDHVAFESFIFSCYEIR